MFILKVSADVKAKRDQSTNVIPYRAPTCLACIQCMPFILPLKCFIHFICTYPPSVCMAMLLTFRSQHDIIMFSDYHTNFLEALTDCLPP